MDPRFIIHIRQQNYGWSCSQTAGADRVFALKEQALQFARLQSTFIAAEVRIHGRDGTEDRFMLAPKQQQEMFSELRDDSEKPTESPSPLIRFTPPKHSWVLRQRTGTNGD